MSKQKKKQAPEGNGFIQRNKFELLLLLAVFAFFTNSVFNGYALDDEFYTNGSNEITNKGIAGIPQMFKTRTFYNNDGSGYSYRPVTLTSFGIEHSIFGQRPHVSHFINLLLYAITIVLLFRLLKKWLSEYSVWFVFFIVLLFAVHPLHAEVVANIKCRDELLALLFCVLSMHWIWRHYETGRWIYFLAYPVAFLAGMLSKFSILPYLFLIPLALWFFTSLNFRRIALYTLPLVGILVATYFIMKVLPTQHRELLMHENPFGSGQADFMGRVATGFYVLGRYVLIHIFPHPLSYYYGYDYIPLVDWSNLLALGSLAFHLWLGYYCLRHLRSKNVLVFAILFYLANLAMFSNIVRPAPGLMAERFAYSASLGFCMAVVLLLFRASKTSTSSFSWTDGGWARMVIVLLALVFGIRTAVRNEDWENKMTLYSHDMEHLDESAKANMLYAALVSKSALEHKHPDSLRIARYHFRRTTEIYPEYATAWSNLGSAYYFEGLYDSSKFYFRKSIALNPNYKEGHFNLGMAHLYTGRPDSARKYFRSAIGADSSYMSAYEQLMKMEAQAGHLFRAMHIIHEAEKHNRKSDQPPTMAGNIYIALSQEMINRAKKDPANAAALNERAKALTARSAAFFEIAAARNPENLDRLQNLSRYFYSAGNTAKGDRYDSIRKAEEKRLERIRRGPKKTAKK